MKKTQILLYICLGISLLNIVSIVYYFNISQSLQSPTLFTVVPPPHSSEISMPDEIALAGEPTPLQRQDVQEALAKELIVNTYLHSHTIQILQTAPRVFAIIEPILKKHGIPDDFKYLAVIESRLNPWAVSPAGAVGVWQIMKNTGKELGLEINDEIDERYHIEKSTEAAATYLKKAYNKLGSWTLAAAAYNGGPNMISKQMTLQKENNYYNLLLGEETERYVFRILALKQIMNHPQMYHFFVSNSNPPEPIQKVEIKGTIKSWSDFAKSHGITYKTLKRFNPWLRKTDLKNKRKKTYTIALPIQKELYQSQN